MVLVEGPVGVPLITPVVEFRVRFGPGGSFPMIDQVYGGVPASTANVT
jgi:hypothetical protein